MVQRVSSQVSRATSSMVQRVSSQVSRATPQDDPFDQLLGHFGRWQLLIFGAVSLVKLSSGWVQMAILFLTPNLTFWCSNMTMDFSDTFLSNQPNLENVTTYDTSIFSNGTAGLYSNASTHLEVSEGSAGLYSNASTHPEVSEGSGYQVLNNTCYSNCNKYSYDATPFDNTIVSEWELVCERRWLAPLTQMLLQLGVLAGSVVFGFLSDRFGRKNTFLFSITTVILLGFLVPLSPSYPVFTAVRFLLGAATAGSMVVSFVIVMEAVGARYRGVVGCLFQIPFVIGHMTVPLFAYFYRRWDAYCLAMAVPPLLYLGYFFILSESPRWLLSVGRVDEAADIVKKAALINQRPVDKVEETLRTLSASLSTASHQPRPNYWALVSPQLRVTTACCGVVWFVTGITFFGFNQYISQTSPDPFVSVAAAGAIQIPSDLSSMWLIAHFGRKVTTVAFLTLGGLCIITLGCVPDIFALTLTLGSLGVCCASVVATTVYIYTSELYPTVVRNMGLGAASTAMRLGSMLAPFVSNLSTPWLPTVIFGLAPILAALVCLALPETRGHTLPDTMDDVTANDSG